MKLKFMKMKISRQKKGHDHVFPACMLFSIDTYFASLYLLQLFFL